MANQIQSRWTYPLVGITSRKSLPRVSSNPRTAFELTGVDGSLQGGLRPFPGFLKGHDFNGGEGTVTDFSAFELRLDSDSSAFGVAYLRGGKAYVDIDFPIDGVVTHQLHDGQDVDGSLDTVAWGRVAYVLIRGFPPVVVRGYREGAVDTVDVQEGGPGPKPRSGAIRYDGSIGSSNTFTTIDPIPLVNNDLDSWDEVDTDNDGSVDDLNSDGLTLRIGFDPNYDNPRYSKFRKGNYSFAYSFYDSRTGRRSQLSDVIELTDEDFPADDDGLLSNFYMEWAWHKDPTNRHAEGSDTLGYRIPKRFEDKWNRIYLWRSVRVEAAGGTYVAAIMHLDKIWPFRWQIEEPDPGESLEETGWVYPLTLEDSELVVQDVRLDHSVLFDQMPRGGTASVLNDVMYVGDIVKTPTLTTLDNSETGQTLVLEDVYPNEAGEGVGEIRWSQTQNPHPELFHWSGKHTPSTSSERPLRLMAVGDAVLSVSRNRTMVIRRAGQFVVVDEVHEGYGTVSRDAVAAVDDAVWFLSDKGLKAISSKGFLSDVPDLDELVTQWWAGTNHTVSLAFDHRAGCLWVLNPTNGHAVILWMETPTITELREVPFSLVRSCPFRNSQGVFQRRALFLDAQNACLWHADHDRSDSRIRLLKTDGECVGTVVSIDPATQSTSGTVVARGREGGPLGVLAGMWVHSTGPDGQDRKFRVVSVQTAGNESSLVLEGDVDLSVGDTLLVSPIVFRWSGGILSGQNEDGVQFMSSLDMFRSRQLSSAGCVFDSLSGSGTFRACSFLGTDQEPSYYGSRVSISEGLPTDYSAFGTYGVSHSSLSPGVEILCADLDFRLLSVLCRGRIDATDKAR